MANVPDEGFVKARLQADLASSDCSRLAAAFLRDTIDAARQTAAHVLVACSAESGNEDIAALLPAGVQLIALPGADYGERVIDAVAYALKMFLARYCDWHRQPDMPLAKFAVRLIRCCRSRTASLRADTRRSFLADWNALSVARALFDGVVWGTPTVFKDIVANTRCLAVYLTTVREWYDIGTVDDLRRLAGELQLESQVLHAHPNLALDSRQCRSPAPSLRRNNRSSPNRVRLTPPLSHMCGFSLSGCHIFKPQLKGCLIPESIDF